MDDSALDFVDLYSKLLKRNRKKRVEQQQRSSTQQQRSSTQQQSSSQDKNKTQQHDSPPAHSSSANCGTMGPAASTEGATTRTKEKVILKMQRFKRDSPQRMVSSDQRQGTDSEKHRQHLQDQAESHREECSDSVDSDEALAKRLQQELDNETRSMDLEDQGLFFCQLCNKNLSHMTPEGRTQHINRCLDEKEGHAPPPPPHAGTLECPICGKGFKSQKSRSSHLKRCSSDMGVPPAVLLQALQRQVEETQSSTAINTHSGAHKRKGSKSNLPASKKPRKKQEDLDEDTLMAMALSSSLLEQEREKTKEVQAVREIIIESTALTESKSPALKWRPNTGKTHSKKKKGAVPRPPPLLLVQDSEAAQIRIQERVSALLLRSRSPSPPTPTRRPSCLPGLQKTAPLWQKSALLSVFCSTDFYTPELTEYIVPLETASNIAHSFESGDNPVSTMQPVSTETPVNRPEVKGPTCSQTLQDLMDLAEDGMTLTQCVSSASQPTTEQQSYRHHSLDMPSSGFVVEENEASSRVSGFLSMEEVLEKNERETQRSKPTPSLLSKLALDLGSMVNNPQLSDVQLQVDTGEVYFAHSFMVYARCPLLAEMIHEAGFGALEEGVPAAQRLLLSDVPGQAVFALLQFLYTAHCSFSSSLLPSVLELASRFDLKELQEFCDLQEETTLEPEESDQQQDKQTDEAFIDLLRSMWNDGDTEDDDTEQNPFDKNNVSNRQEDLGFGEEEMKEERVNEEELVEIYEFAATQRRKDESDDEAEENAEPCDVPEVFSGSAEKDDPKQASYSLDQSYDRLFSQSWGEFRESDLSALPRDKLQSQHLLSTCRPSETSSRGLLQSSASVIDKMSPSPPANAQNLPVPGLSPGSPHDKSAQSKQDEETNDILKRQDSEAKPNNEPELVVLSDSSDDMNIDLTQCLSSPSPKNTKHFTGIKEQDTPNSHDQNMQQVSDGEASPLDGSAEVSWLVPSTPVQATSSQIKTSTCRTQLFPIRDSPQPSSPQSPHKSSPRKPPKSGSASFDLTNDKRLDSSGFAVPRSPRKQMHPTSPSRFQLSFDKQGTPLPVPAYSSTPVHTDLPKLLQDPPLSADKVATTQNKTGKIVKAPEEEEVQSFHLSPLSEQSSSHSKANRSSDKSGGSEQGNRGRKKETEVASLCDNAEDNVEAEDAESSFRHSFTDEPPMAFNDSWGLDACFENPRFSLKLDDSGGSLQKDDNPSFKPTTSLIRTSTPPGQGSSASPEQAQPDNYSFMNSNIWDSWEEEEEEDGALPLSQRLKPAVQHKTPISNFKKRQDLVPITPMPHYSDMDTPELKNKLNKFGVRPLPKRQMVLKLKEIHQYTHQLLSSDSEGEAPPAGQSAQDKPPRAKFKLPAASPRKLSRDDGPLSASQGSNTSSTAESERSNPELVHLSEGDSDSDGGVSASQSVSRLQERLQSVRTFILSDSSLYSQILQYKPLVLSQLQQQLKAAGIRLGVSKLADYLDSQCITFTTAKPGQSAPSRRRVRKTKAGGEGGVRRKKNTAAQ